MNHPLPIEVGYVPPTGKKKISIQLSFHTNMDSSQQVYELRWHFHERLFVKPV